MVTALPACHGTAEPFIYLVRRGDKGFLYAHDTDIFSEAMWEYLGRTGVVLNLVSLDCTEGSRPMDYSGHMNLERNLAVRERMLRTGIADGGTVFAFSHISHNGRMNHRQAELAEVNKGMVAAYDGLELHC